MPKLKRKGIRPTYAESESSSCVVVYGGESTENSNISYVGEPELREFARRLRTHSKKYQNINLLIFGVDLICVNTDSNGELRSSVLWRKPARDDSMWQHKISTSAEVISRDNNPVLLVYGIDKSPFTLDDINSIANDLRVRKVKFYTLNDLFLGFQPVFKRSVKSSDKELATLDIMAAMVKCPYYKGQLEHKPYAILTHEASTDLTETITSEQNGIVSSPMQPTKSTSSATHVTIDDSPETFEYTDIQPKKSKLLWVWLLVICMLCIACFFSGRFLMHSYMGYIKLQQETQIIITQLLECNKNCDALQKQVALLETQKDNIVWDASYDELQSVISRINKVDNMRILTLGPVLTYVDEFRVDNFKIQGTELCLVGYVRTERTPQMEAQMETTAYNLITQYVQSDETVQKVLNNSTFEPKSFIILDLTRTEEFYGLNFNVRWDVKEK